jgi:hypothetical protein
MTIQVMVFWVVKLCSDVVVYQRFGEPFCFHLQSEANSANKGKWTKAEGIERGRDSVDQWYWGKDNFHGTTFYTGKRPSRDSSVVIALRYGLDDRGSRVRFPAGAGNYSLHHHVQNGSGAHPTSYPMGTRGSFSGGKAAGA